MSGTNAVTPRPSWPANGDIPESKTAPLSETQWTSTCGNKSGMNSWSSPTSTTGSRVLMEQEAW